MLRISTIEPREATGTLKKFFNAFKKKRERMAEVHKFHSLNLAALIQHMHLYMTLMFGKFSLKRAQRETSGTVLSAMNSCRYCVLHHSEALYLFLKKRKQNKPGYLQLQTC